MKRKRGSIIVESALVLPIAVLTVFLLLSLSFRFYDDVNVQSKHFSVLRDAQKTEGSTNFGEAKFAGTADFLVEGLQDTETGK
jgi:hypothetical protein